MRPEQTSFRTGWWSIDLPGYRDHPAPYRTYSLFPYESLPPLPEGAFRGEFQWLKGEDPHHRPAPEEQEAWSADFDRFVAAAARIGWKLPTDFLTFMGSLDLQSRIRSCTDYFFVTPDSILPSPKGDGGFLTHFLSDSQGCLFWYLYLRPTGEHCVVVSGSLLGSDLTGQAAGESGGGEQSAGEIFFCAPFFEAFVYRFWIENEIGLALSDGAPVTKEQRAYLNHYQKRSGRGRRGRAK